MRWRLATWHATAVAYVALLVALGGTGYAATTVFPSAPGHAMVSSAHGRRGPSGPTTITSQPAWSDVDGSAAHLLGSSQYYGEFQEFDIPNGITGSHSDQLQIPLLSPSTLSGTAQHLASLQFCYAAIATPGVSTIGLDHMFVYEYDQPNLSFAPGTTAQTPDLLPSDESTVTLASQAISPSLTTSGCPTFTFNTVALDPNAYVVIDLEAFHSNNGGQNHQAVLFLGRVTYTLSP